MSHFISFGSAAAPVDIDAGYEFLGSNSNGSLTQVTANIAKSSYVTLGSTTGDLVDLELHFGVGSSSTARFLVDIALGGVGSEVILIPDIWVQPNTVGFGIKVFRFKLNVPAGTRISARAASTANATSLYAAVVGRVRTVNDPPGFNHCEFIYPYASSAGMPLASGALPSTLDVTGVTSANTGWTTISPVGGTTRAYGALVANAGLRASGASPATAAQQATLRLGLGGSGATDATIFHQKGVVIASGTPPFPLMMPWMIQKAIPSGSRVAMEMLVATSAPDLIAAQAWGLYA